MREQLKRSGTVAQIFGTSFVGTFGFLYLLVEIRTHFFLSWIPKAEANTLIPALFVCISVIASLFAVLIRMSQRTALPTASLSFDESLINALTSALASKCYADVIRIGLALNRPLFEEGKFSVRLTIGKIVEEAGALSGRKDVQVVALIDAIGWSLVELGQYKEAQRQIEHGVNLSLETEQVFYRAKGQRHLGVICRRTGDYLCAQRLYETSLSTAKTIVDPHMREELIAGLNYALASLFYHTQEYSKAMDFVEKAIVSFTTLNDEYRLNMSWVLKGDIQVTQNLPTVALDTYRKVLEHADTNTEKLQVVRACLGLAEIYINERDWTRARRSIDQAAGLSLDEFKAEAERLKSLRAMLPPG